jgi:hypothetical protein
MYKKITAILLLSLFLFNWIGYRLLTSYLEVQADAKLQTQLDENSFDDSQLISVKTPVTHLSYFNNSPLYEIASGKIEIGGVLYHYVKRRIYNDSLEVLCIPNPMAMQLRTAKKDFFLFVSGLQHSTTDPGKKQSANASFSKDISSEYYPTEDMSWEAIAFYITFRHYGELVSFLPSFYARTPEQPPDGIGIIA